MVQLVMVSWPGSLEARFSVHVEPSSTEGAPLRVSVGGTLLTTTPMEFDGQVPSSSVTLALMGETAGPSAGAGVGEGGVQGEVRRGAWTVWRVASRQLMVRWSMVAAPGAPVADRFSV